MFLKFWGTRGSLPRPGAQKLKYGGNTSCVEVRTASGHLIILDCGTGAYDLGRSLAAAPEQPTKGALLISHYHWDHIQGLPFFAPLFIPGNEWDIYAPRGLHQSLRETLSGQMQYEYFPITLDAFGATIRYHDLVEGVFDVGDARIEAKYLNHPALTLGFRIEADDASLVYACDHESASRRAVPEPSDLLGAERDHVQFLSNADLVVHDAQYVAEEYETRIGWGHSTVDYAIEVAKAAGARRLAISHHDPDRTDEAIDDLIEGYRAKLAEDGAALELSAAKEGEVLQVESAGEAAPRPDAPDFSATEAVGSAVTTARLELGAMRPEVERVIREAAAAEGVEIDPPRAHPGQAGGAEPPIVVIDREAAPEESATLIARAGDDDMARDAAPILAIADGEDAGAPPEDASLDLLVWPFSKEFAQSRIRAAVLRERCRWARAPKPEDEVERLASLRRLNVLDTPTEERFDRITRIARRAFDVPLSLVTFIDSDRQWFKSRVGLDFEETTRDAAFCAHTILRDEALIVEDTVLDDRFADYPSVRGAPYVRFYAGHPLRIGGAALGSLCLLDFRPHRFGEEKAELLADLAQIVISELLAPPLKGDPSPRPDLKVVGGG